MLYTVQCKEVRTRLLYGQVDSFSKNAFDYVSLLCVCEKML